MEFTLNKDSVINVTNSIKKTIEKRKLCKYC